MKMPLIKNGFFVTVLMSLDWRLFCAWSRKKKSHFRGERSEVARRLQSCQVK